MYKNDRNLDFEVDTGASVTLIAVLTACSRKLKTNSICPVQGITTVSVEVYQGPTCELQLIVVRILVLHYKGEIR